MSTTTKARRQPRRRASRPPPIPRPCSDLARRLYRAWGYPAEVSSILAGADEQTERSGLNRFGPGKIPVPGLFLSVTAEWVRDHVTLAKGRPARRAIRSRYIWDAIYHRLLRAAGFEGGPGYGASTMDGLTRGPGTAAE